MNHKQALYWNEKIVMSHLIHAASIHRRMPPIKVQGYFSLWPETLKNDWERLYDQLNGRTTLGAPMPPEVTYHEKVMDLLSCLDRNEQQITWMRANKIPWYIVVQDLQTSQSTLQRRMRVALNRLIQELNRRDVSGEYYRRLRNRANGLLKD